METITKKSLTLHVETSKGYELTKEFADYAELFDFVTTRLMGDSAFDHEASQLIEHTPEQWARRGENYPKGNFWTDIEDRPKETL